MGEADGFRQVVYFLVLYDMDAAGILFKKRDGILSRSPTIAVGVMPALSNASTAPSQAMTTEA